MQTEPRSKQSREIVEAEFSAPTTFQDDEIFGDEEPDAFAKIRAYCESGSGSGMLGIYRALPQKKEQFICKLDAADFDPEIIKGRFGGGDFIIKAYDERSKIKLKQHLSIEGEPIIERIKPFHESANYPIPGAPPFDARELVTMMQESNRQLLAGLVQVLQPQSNARSDMLQEMLTMKELFSTGQQPASGGVEMIMKGIELARSMEPRTGEATGMDVLLESIKSFAPAIGEVVKHSQGQGAARRFQAKPQQPQQPQQPQPSQHQEALPSPEIPQPENEENMLFKYYIGLLVGFAKENRDPVLYADLIADNLPEEKIMELINNPQVVDYLGSINPGVIAHRAWFESVVSELKIIMSLTDSEFAPSVESQKTNLPDKNATIANGNDGTT